MIKKNLSFSVKIFTLTFFLLVLCLGGIVLALTIKSPPKKAQKGSLHAIVLPIENNDNNTEETNSIAVPSAEKEPSLTLKASKGLVSIIIYDYGLSDTNSKKIIESNIKNLSLSLSPYTTRPIYWIDTARQFDQEPWNSLYITSGKSNHDYGPLEITPNNRRELSQKHIEASLNHSNHSNGAIIYYDASNPMKELVWVNEAITSRALSSVFISKSYYIDKSTVFSNNWVEYNTSLKSIKRSLTSVSQDAQDDGYAIIALPPTENTLKALRSWKKTLKQSKLSLVPLSSIIKVTEKK